MVDSVLLTENSPVGTTFSVMNTNLTVMETDEDQTIDVCLVLVSPEPSRLTIPITIDVQGELFNYLGCCMVYIGLQAISRLNTSPTNDIIADYCLF